jgi:predicted O-methyltransferase YrrM
MGSNLSKFLWYLKRPGLYPYLIHRVCKKLFTDSLQEDTLLEATQWCAERAVDTSTAYRKLTGEKNVPIRVNSLFFHQFENARKIEEECPHKMGGAGDLDLLYWSAEYLGASRVIETGVAYGWSSLTLLLSLSNRKGSMLISTDMPYQELNNDSYVGCVVPEYLRSMWQLLRVADYLGLPRALKAFSEIDMCHYDSDKSYDGMMWAYPRLWAALRPGGFFISDDIGDNIAFLNFSRKVHVDPVVIEQSDKYIGVLVKQHTFDMGQSH